MVNQKRSFKGAISPLSFFDNLSSVDIGAINAQMANRKYDPSIVTGVSRRCSWGFPQVFVCNPLRKMKPFPTLFWLSCPFLVKRCAEEESKGRIPEIEKILDARRGQWKIYNQRASLLRLMMIPWERRQFLHRYCKGLFRSIRATMIGGISPRERPTAKCLHLQVGTWLSLPGHPAEKWLSEIFPDRECSCPDCQVCGKGKLTSFRNRELPAKKGDAKCFSQLLI